MKQKLMKRLYLCMTGVTNNRTERSINPLDGFLTLLEKINTLVSKNTLDKKKNIYVFESSLPHFFSYSTHLENCMRVKCICFELLLNESINV